MTRTAATAAGTETGWTVDFWLDPACPLTRHTARWIALIADEVPLQVCWRVISLSVLNEHRDDDPEDDPRGYLWIPARVAAAIQTQHGHDALGAFYDALWTELDGTERQWIGDISEALHRSGLPVGLAEAGTSTDHDAELRASHHGGVDRIDAEIGTPVLAITTPDRNQQSFFGPVHNAVPTKADAMGVWEATPPVDEHPDLPPNHTLSGSAMLCAIPNLREHSR